MDRLQEFYEIASNPQISTLRPSGEPHSPAFGRPPASAGIYVTQ